MRKHLIQIPPAAKTFELPGSTLWFDEYGILCSISNDIPPQNLEQAREAMESLLGFLGPEKKFCMLRDVTHSAEMSREVRNFAGAELPKITRAIALLSQSALGKMLANLFFSITSQPYPVRYFTDETEARAWLKQYL